MPAHIVAADTLYLLYFVEEVSTRLDCWRKPRVVPPGRRPIMEIAGIEQRLIGWQSSPRSADRGRASCLHRRVRGTAGAPAGGAGRYALGLPVRGSDQTRPPKRTEVLLLTELRE